ncbi:MarR family winged helix-turn-helix transcriptional regulator [Umezawaea beigongshangensis]|uniref:MarR family winged helix-turn-helix transcriptional regulator n=1 Tax=Umezawaea beigongshangensis TaxID=2780383 RepID=UPI0018F200E4|nr:MarR family transcriptional regulator [Umezawaea beigongshangensis]
MPSEPADPLALERQVCFALSVASRGVVAVYRPILAPLGLTHPQYLVMLALWQRAPMSVKELSATLALDPGTLSPLLKRLEAAGYVSRQRDRSDERALAVTLTGTGAALRRRALEVPAKVVAALGVEPEELQRLNEALGTITAAARRVRPPDGPGLAVGRPEQ